MYATRVALTRRLTAPFCAVAKASALCATQRAYYDKMQEEMAENGPDAVGAATGEAAHAAPQYAGGAKDHSDEASRLRMVARTNNDVISAAEKLNAFFSLWLIILMAWGIYMCGEFDERPLRERA